MGAFKSFKIIPGSTNIIPQVGRDIMDYFIAQDFDVKGDSLISGGYDISISRGNLIKTVSGMKMALKIQIRPQAGQIYIEAGAGVLGQQALPTIISFVICWPIIFTQIWGIIQQSNLDEKAIEIAEASVLKHGNASACFQTSQPQNSKYCTQCGQANMEGAKFCRECGGRL